nr:hypothetical protein Iba_chr10eCG8090 [Ipomoea batatas]
MVGIGIVGDTGSEKVGTRRTSMTSIGSSTKSDSMVESSDSVVARVEDVRDRKRMARVADTSLDGLTHQFVKRNSPEWKNERKAVARIQFTYVYLKNISGPKEGGSDTMLRNSREE